MNNEKILKKKIQQYLLMPLALTVLLVGMVIVLYVHDKKSGAIAAAAVFIFVVCEIIFFIVMKAAIMPVVFRFALEQGQIQKELLKELDIPYALLDTDGKILWGNAKFIEEIGVGSKKRIRKTFRHSSRRWMRRRYRPRKCRWIWNITTMSIGHCCAVSIFPRR